MTSEVDTSVETEQTAATEVTSQVDGADAGVSGGDAAAAPAAAPAAATAAATAAADPEVAALVEQIDKLTHGSSAESAVAAERLGSAGIGRDELLQILADRDNAKAGPAKTDAAAAADPLDEIPEEVRPVMKALVRALDKKLQPTLAVIQRLEAEQQRQQQAAAEQAVRREFDSVVQASPVYKLLEKSGAGAQFARMAETEVSAVWTERVNHTQAYYARLGRQISQQEAASMTPPLTKRDYEDAATRAALPFKAFAAATRASSGGTGLAPADPPPVGGRNTGTAIGLAGGKNGAAPKQDFDYSTTEGRVAALAAALDRTRPRSE